MSTVGGSSMSDFALPRLVHCLLLAVVALAPQARAADAAAPGPALAFDGTRYLHRWSKATQHEFTPASQPSLEHWTDMITVNVYPGVKDGEALAGAANAVLGNYQRAGKILRTQSVPRTPAAEAQHFIGAALGQSQFLEAVFTRLLLVEGTGYAVTYSHRIYGPAVGPEMSAWLKEHGARSEAQLMAMDRLPGPKALAALPQAR